MGYRQKSVAYSGDEGLFTFSLLRAVPGTHADVTGQYSLNGEIFDFARYRETRCETHADDDGMIGAHPQAGGSVLQQARCGNGTAVQGDGDTIRAEIRPDLGQKGEADT
jgi:hypothetical protein